MGITLTGKRVQNTYDSLLKLSSNDNLTSTPQLVGDGLGNDSPIYLSETKVGIGVSPSFQFQTSDAAKIGGNLTVGGNLIVEGSTTQVDSTIVQIGDNMIELAKDNVANIKDIGWYGTIVESGTKYVGTYYDASSGITTPTFYIGLGTTEPSNTASWTVKGKLVIGDLSANGGDFTDTVYIDDHLEIENSDGYGYIELGGSSGGYIDLKGPFSNDFDLRIFTDGTNSQINAIAGSLDITANSGIDLQYQGSNKLTVISTGIDITGNLFVSGGFKDSDEELGTSGQVLSSTGTGTDWVDFDADSAKALEIDVKNVFGATMTKGTVVHAEPTGTLSGNVIEVVKADANVAANMPAIGVLNEDLNDDEEGKAVMFGTVQGIDTLSFSVGDELYVSTTAGAFTNTKPTATTEQVQKIAVVVKSHASNGLIKVFGAGRSNDVPNLIERSVAFDGGNLSFGDDDKIIFGDNQDFNIQSNGVNTFLSNLNNNLVIQNSADDKDIIFRSDNGDGTSVSNYLVIDGSTGGVNLYHYGTKKFETTSSGIKVTGPTDTLLANQPLIVGEFIGTGTDGLALISVDHTTASTASALGAGIRFKTGDGTSGSNTKSGYIFMQGGGNSDVKYIAPRTHTFYVDGHDDDITGTTYNDYGTIGLHLAEDGNVHIPEYLYHYDNAATYLRFQQNRLSLYSGGGAIVDLHSNGNLYFTGDAIFYDTITLAGTSNEIIKSNGSIRLDIDNNNDQTDRVFILSKHNSATELFRVNEDGDGTFGNNIYGNLIELQGYGFKGGEGDLLDSSTFGQSGIGNTFRWIDQNSGNTGSTWRKVCDVTLNNSFYDGVQMEVVVWQPDTNWGEHASLIKNYYSVAFRGDASDVGPFYNNVLIYGINADLLRAYKTGTYTYELQARTSDDNKDLVVEYTITSKNNSKVIPNDSYTAATTSGGTAYTASANSLTKTKFAGEVEFQGTTIGDDLRVNGFLFLGAGADSTYGGYLTNKGSSAEGISMKVRDNDGFDIYQVWGNGGEAALSFEAVDEQIKLYYSGSEKLNTNTDGVDIYGRLKLQGNYPYLLFTDTQGTDEDAFIANNANGLFFGKTNTPASANDILKLDLSNKASTFYGDLTVNEDLVVKGTHTSLSTIEVQEDSTHFGRLHYMHSDFSTTGTNIAESLLLVSSSDATGGIVVRADAPSSEIKFAIGNSDAENIVMKITDGANGVEFFPTTTAEGGHIALRADTDGSYRYAIDNYNDTLRIVRQADADATGGVVVTNVDGNGDFNVLRDFIAGRTGYFTSNSADSRVLYLDQHAVDNGNIIQFRDHNNDYKWELVGRNNQFYIYNNALSRHSIYINPTNNKIGINGNASPKALLHITDSTNSYPIDNNNKLVVESDGHTYIGLGSGDSSDVGIHFGDSTAVNRGRLAYIHSEDAMKISTNGGVRHTITNNGTVLFNNYNADEKTGTATYLLGTDSSGNIVKTTSLPFNSGGSSQSKRYQSFSGTPSSGTWFPLFQINEQLGPITCKLYSYAHDSVEFSVSEGYSASNAGTITILNSVHTSNGGYATVAALRILQDGWVEAQFTWGSGPTVDIGINISGYNVPNLVTSLAASTNSSTVVDIVGVNQTGLLSAKSRIEVGRNSSGVGQTRFVSNGTNYMDGSGSKLGIGTNNPTAQLEVSAGPVFINTSTQSFSEKLVVDGITRTIGLHVAGGVGYSNYANFVHDDNDFTISTARVSGTGDINLEPYGDVIIGSGNLGLATTPSSKLHIKYANGSYSSDTTSGFINEATSGRGTMRIRSTTDNPAELFFDVNSAIRWDISCRSGANPTLNFYPQAATPSLTGVSAHVLELQQDGDVIVTGNGSSGKFGIRNSSPSAFLTLGTYPTAGTYINQSTYPDVPGEHMIHITAPSTTNYYGGGISFGENGFTAANIVAIDAGGGGALHLAFGTGNSGGMTERLRIDNGGTVIAKAELRANTSVRVFGNNVTDIAATNSPTTTSANIGTYANQYSFIDLSSSNASGSWIDFSNANGTDYRGRIRYNFTSDHMKFYAGAGERMQIEVNQTKILNKLEVAQTTYSAIIGQASFTWGGSTSQYPTVYGSAADRWVMYTFPHIPCLQNGVNGHTGSSTGAKIRFASNPAASSYWDAGVDLQYNAADRFSIGRAGALMLNILTPNSTYSGLASRDWTIFGSGSRAGAIVINDIAGANYAIYGGGYDLTFAKSVSGTSLASALSILGDNAADSSPDVRVHNNFDVQGNWYLDGINGGHFENYTYGPKLDISELSSGGWARSYKIETSDSTGCITMGVLGFGTTTSYGYFSIAGNGDDTGFSTGNSIKLTKSGSVGIGLGSTATPGVKLDVNGEGRFVSNSSSRVLYLKQNAANAGNIIQFQNQSGTNVWENVGRDNGYYIYNANQGYAFFIRHDNNQVGIKRNTGISYALDVNGAIRATGDVIAFSDKRVKENIVTIDNALEKVSKLRGVSYTRKDAEDKSTKVGVIAQEVLDVLPEVVKKDDDGMYSVAYGNMAGVFIEAIKELKAEIEELKKCNCKCNCK